MVEDDLACGVGTENGGHDGTLEELRIGLGVLGVTVARTDNLFTV